MVSLYHAYGRLSRYFTEFSERFSTRDQHFFNIFTNRPFPPLAAVYDGFFLLFRGLSWFFGVENCHRTVILCRLFEIFYKLFTFLESPNRHKSKDSRSSSRRGGKFCGFLSYGAGEPRDGRGRKKGGRVQPNAIKLSLPLLGRWHTEGVTERAFQTVFALSPAFGGSSPGGRALPVS